MPFKIIHAVIDLCWSHTVCVLCCAYRSRRRTKVFAAFIHPITFRGPTVGLLSCQSQLLQSASGMVIVATVNLQEGRGLWSDPVTAQTAAIPPDSPSAPTVLGSNRTSVSIRWDAPASDGGSAVLSYEVELRPKSKAALASMPHEWVTVYQVRFTSYMPAQIACCAYNGFGAVKL